MRRTVLAIVMAAGLASDGLAQEGDRYAQYRQSPQVLAHYPDVPIALDSPGLAAGRTDFTSQPELEAFVAKLAASSHRIKAGSLGKSQQGRDIPYLLATAEGLSDPAAIVALKRPVVWLIGLQHGNEPAGGEAMLAVANALAGGELAALTDKITVVIVPRANPDGAAAFKRATANGADPNRDHLLMMLPETRALHTLMNVLPPDVVLDTHEFTVANRWIAKFNALQAVDALLLSTTHPMVNREIAQLADGVFRPRIDAALKARDLTSFDYYTASLDAPDKTVSMGGNAPGAARNTFGLANAVSFLIETRGVGIGREGFQRRVATHYIAARAVLETAAEQAEALHAATQKARATPGTSDIIVAHKLAVAPRVLPLLDPVNGEAKPTEVAFRDSHAVTPTTVRARPAGYLLLAEGANPRALDALRLNGVTACRVTQAADADAEAFTVRERASVNRESINPAQAVKVEVTRHAVHIPGGATFVPAGQGSGTLAALALEPDSPGSLTGVGLVSPPAGSGELPLYRLSAAPRLAPGAFGDPALCKP
jgi:hypothetical protein